MRVGLTLHFVRRTKLTGIERFSLSCARALALAPQPDLEILILASRSAAALLPGGLACATMPGDWRLFGEQVVLPAWSGTRRLDGLHVTAFGGSLVRPVPFVLTVYDSVFWDEPASLSRLGRYYYKRMVEGALSSSRLRALVFISAAARDAVRQHLPGLRVPMEVVHAAPGMPRAARWRDTPTDPDRTLQVLSVGTIEPRKNLAGMARAIAALRAHLRRPVRWIHIGRRGWLGPDEIAVLASGAVEELGQRSDDELHQHLASSDVLLSLSSLEGFNLPLVEALGLGTPAVVTDLPVHREVAGDGALFAPVGDSDTAAVLLARLLSDRDVWTACSRAGWQHTARFLPGAMAGRLFSIYRDAFA